MRGEKLGDGSNRGQKRGHEDWRGLLNIIGSLVIRIALALMLVKLHAGTRG